MRNILTAFFAFALSTFVAGMSALWIAEETHAQEEFILVFMSIAPLGLLFALPLLAASFRPRPRSAVSLVARWLLALLVLAVVGLFSYAFYIAQAGIGFVRDLPVLAGIAIPAAAILLLQWAVFAWRARPPAVPPLQFGRNGAP